MKRDELRNILKDLNPSDEVISSIMALNGNDVNALNAEITTLKTQLSDSVKDIEDLKKNDKTGELKTQLEEMQTKYNNAIADINKRTYSDAVKAAIAEKGIKFTSKSAENYYMSQAEGKKMEIKDGKLVGFDDFHKAQFEADKGAFVIESKPDTQTPAPGSMHFAGTAGNGGNSAVSAAALAAQRFSKAYNPTAADVNTNITKGE